MRRIALPAALVAAIVAVAALATGGHGSSAAAAVARAAQKAMDSGSSRVSITLSPRAPGRPALRMQGVMDYRGHRGRLTYDDAGWDTIYDGDVTYFKWTGVTRWLPKAKPWLRVAGEEDDPFDPQERALRDPASLLGFIRSVSSGVERAGRETIDGVETTRYDGTLDLAKIVQTAPPDRREELQLELDFLKEHMPTAFPFTVWVDERGVARRLRYEQQDEGSSTIDFFDFGVPVVLDLPRPDEVMTDEEFSALMQAYFREHPDGECGSSSSDTSESSGEGDVVIELCAAPRNEGAK